MSLKKRNSISGRARAAAAEMASARINLKNIDYFKFKKLVIDANRDDYNSCAKEVRALCDDVQTLRFRDEEFDDETDRGRFAQICTYYKQILLSKRIDPTDVRIKSGWWGDHKNAYSAGKLKPAILRDVLLAKAKDWARRSGESEKYVDKVSVCLDGPGLYVFKHKDHQCFQFVGNSEKIFTKCAEILKQAYEGASQDPLGALLIISVMSDWDFYIIPVTPNDDEHVLRILENDLIVKHDSIWPHGLNFRLHIDSLLEVSEFRKSCLRHKWPPTGDSVSDSLDLNIIREQVKSGYGAPPTQPQVEPQSTPKKEPKAKPKPEWVGVNEENKENKEMGEKVDDGKMIYIPLHVEEDGSQPDDDAVSVSSTCTYVKDGPDVVDEADPPGRTLVRRGSYTVSSPVIRKKEVLKDGEPKSPRKPAPVMSAKSPSMRKQNTNSRPGSTEVRSSGRSTPNGTPKKTPRKSAVRSSVGGSMEVSSKGRHSRASSDGDSYGTTESSAMVSSTDTMERSASSLSDEAQKQDAHELRPSKLPIAPASPRR